jgi:hypothetical protein
VQIDSETLVVFFSGYGTAERAWFERFYEFFRAVRTGRVAVMLRGR